MEDACAEKIREIELMLRLLSMEQLRQLYITVLYMI